MTVINYFTPNGKKRTASHCQGLFDLFFVDLFTAIVAMDGIARTALWNNYKLDITVIAELPRIYGWANSIIAGN